MTESLIRYNAARNALAEAVRVDEVKDIRDQAVAMQVYAQQAKDMELMKWATEIKLRAERRLGEMMKAQPKATGTKNQLRGTVAGPGSTPILSGGVSETPPEAPATLTEVGIDKNLAKRARTAAAMSEEQFETRMQEAAQAAAKSVEKPKPAPKLKPNKGPKPERRIPPEKTEVVAALVLDDGKSYGEAAVEVGVSETVVRRSVAHEEGRRQGRTEAEIDPTLLPLSAQQKLEGAIRQHKRKLDMEFEERVREEMRRLLEETVLPHYNKKMEEFDQVIKARKGVLTTAEYRLILSCLHPDQSATPDRIRKAFEILKSHELALRGEKELPTIRPAIPRTWEELQKAREEVKARRKRQSNGVQVHH